MPTTSPQHSTPAVPVVTNRRSAGSLHAQLLRAASSDRDVDHVRGDLRRIVKDITGATFAAHMVCDANGECTIDKSHFEGELPENFDVQTICSIARAALGRQATQVKTFSEKHQTQVVCAPVSIPGNSGEVLGVVLHTESTNLQSSIYTLQLAASYQRLWARGNVGIANQWKLNSLAAIVELVTAIEQQDSLASAANTAVNQVARYLGCARVVIGTMKGRDLRIRALSGITSFDPTSDAVTAMRDALAECKLHEELCCWPPEHCKRSGMLGHQSLANQCHFKSLLSCPLTTPDGKFVGAWLFADNGNAVQGERFENFVRAASPRVASAIELVDRSQRGVLARTKQALQKLVRGRKGRATLLAVALLTLLMLLPFPYRVRCRCIVEPVARRYAVAPFSGMIDEGFVEPGDVVLAGTLLAKMDGRELKWEFSAAHAKREQARKQREVELSERDVPQVLISQLETEQLTAQIDILRHRMDHLELKSPVAGVVLSGSLDKGQSTPVEKGDVLYEIGPLDKLKIEIEVPATEVAQVAEGQHVKLWLDGLENEPISGRIAQLEPRSQLRRDQNVFIAKLTISNPDHAFRPGMRGSARVTGPLRPLGWNLFHKPWDYAVSRLTWW